jgi:hypothetical protein
MNDSEVKYPENPQLSIAAALHLLSSASVQGTNVARCEALLRHLERLSVDQALAEPLRRTCAGLYRTWTEVMQSMQDGETGETGEVSVLPLPLPEGQWLH